MKKEIDIEYEKGEITFDEMNEELASTSYRNGIWRLDEETLDRYLENDGVLIAAVGDMREFFFAKCDCDGFLSETTESNLRIAKLPMFYIDFDRKLYRHRDIGRGHQDYSFDWDADEEDFEHLIFDSDKYWISGSVNYWRLLLSK